MCEFHSSLAVDVGATVWHVLEVSDGMVTGWATAVFRLVNNDLDSLQKFLEE
jgi:hypothetical protein